LDPDQDLVVNRTLWPQIVWRTFEKREYGNWSKFSYRFSKLHPLFSWYIRQLRCQKNKFRASTYLIDFNPQDRIQILEFCSRLQIRIQHPDPDSEAESVAFYRNMWNSPWNGFIHCILSSVADLNPCYIIRLSNNFRTAANPVLFLKFESFVCYYFMHQPFN
jgi:hypothetical protein